MCDNPLSLLHMRLAPQPDRRGPGCIGPPPSPGERSHGKRVVRTVRQNGGMGLAVLLAALVVLYLFGLGLAMRRAPRVPGSRTVPYRRALPWITGGMALAASVLAAIPLPGIVIVSITIYTGLAVAAVWRMASLDRASVWMLPSRRLARISLSVVALIWLGSMLALLLWIADMVAEYALAG